LVGKTVQGHLFVQREPSQSVWRTSTLEPITIRVVAADLLSVTCDIKEVALTRADAEQTCTASGRFVGLWKVPDAAPAAASK
jgi:hypothetical protein